MKACSRCGEDKPLEAYVHNGDGRRYSQCKPCANAAQTLRRHAARPPKPKATSKTCKDCGVDKPLSDFPNGRRCAPCRKAHDKHRYADGLIYNDTCSACGKPVMRAPTSRQEIVCRPCRRIAKTKGCPICGTSFYAKTNGQTCSSECGNELRRPVGSTRRTGRTCEACGSEYTATYTAQRTCGRECGNRIRRPAVRVRRPTKPKAPKAPKPTVYIYCKRCQKRVVSRTARHVYCSRICAEGFFFARPCSGCGNVNVASPRKKCDECLRLGKRATNRHRKRAAKYGVQYEPIKASKVYERDGWVCGICKEPVDQTLEYPHLMYASLDHIIPMALGGPHTYENVQLAHFICNSMKGAKRISAEEFYRG